MNCISTHTTLLKSSVLTDVEKYSQSTLMKDIFYKILKLAKLDVNAIIVGEIGSGKKRLAKTIHANSARAQGPFQSFYCVDVTESEYQEKFWGQLSFEGDHLTLRYDILEKASNGILFLDQFSELSPVLMEKIIESYLKGCSQLFRYNQLSQPRLILSLNQESYQTIVQMPVWQQLLDQLDPMVIMLPPLRERKEDIPQLIQSLLQEIKTSYAGYKDLTISTEALYECFNYSWPGNIRQLKNALLQGAILSYGKTIEIPHLPFTMNWKLPYNIDQNEKL